MQKKTAWILAVALLGIGPVAASAQDDGVKGKWSVTFGGGAAVPVGGDFHEGGSGTVLGLRRPSTRKSYPDVYEPVRMARWFGYGVARNVEFSATSPGSGRKTSSFRWQRRFARPSREFGEYTVPDGSRSTRSLSPEPTSTRT